MHSSVGIPAPANWLISQRLASWSYSTTGSPWPLVWHTPPKPAQMVAMSHGAEDRGARGLVEDLVAFVDHLDVLRQHRPRHRYRAARSCTHHAGEGMPSKFRMGAGITSGDSALCTTESLALWSLINMCGLALASCSF